MKNVLFLIVSLPLLFSCGKHGHKVKDFSKHFDEYDMTGAFVLYDVKNERYTGYNLLLGQKGFLPASTFKIVNSLIGLETGIVKDKDFIIPWDSIERPNKEWNKNHSLASAFKVSCVPYYQELAKRIGEKRMKEWVEKINYGNQDIGNKIDEFWLDGNLRISAEQQVDFMTRLYKNELPFSQRSIDIVKDIMTVGQKKEYTEHAKTGLTMQDSLWVGWYTGYFESKDNTFIFATLLTTPEENTRIIEARKEITYKIFNELEIF